MSQLLKETGIRNISALRDRYPKAEIYFHQDLDGVTTALAMKKYLEDNGIKVVDTHVIQYGDKEFAVKKNDAQGDTMPVLVDFAHGKPMFTIHTDHHDKQVGVEKDTSKQFRSARSNVETISQVVSPKDIFPNPDVLIINTVDSADFIRQGVTPEEVVNYIFRIDKEKDLQKNKMLMGLVTNKLVLAFKNKKGFLEYLVMNSQPSLLSILTSVKNWMSKYTKEKPEDLQKNAEDYVESMKGYTNKKYEDGIIYQYGMGRLTGTGSYDRYTPFRNHPDADFLIMAWPLGLVQASCNPFKKERGLKGVNLGEIAQEVLSKWEGQLKERKIPLSTIKYISESSVGPESVGFTFKDFDALYGGNFIMMDGGEKVLDQIKEMMDKPFSELTEQEKEMLDKIGVNAWDLIQSQSGGHKCITNISGLNYLGRSKRPSTGPYRYDPEKEDALYIKFVKMIASEFKNVLKNKIKESKVESLDEQDNLKIKTQQPASSTYLKPKTNSNSIINQNEKGFFMFFIFPKYRPTLDDSWWARTLQKLGQGAEELEKLFKVNEQKGKQLKMYATGHGGCIIINRNGEVDLFEFGPYDSKGEGKVLHTQLGKIANFDKSGQFLNPGEVASKCKTKTFKDGPRLEMWISMLTLPSVKSALQNAKTTRKYNLLDIFGGGSSNCATYAVDVANAGGIRDVSVNFENTTNLSTKLPNLLPEKPITIYKKFNQSKFFLKNFKV